MKFQRILVPIALATLGFLTTHAAKLGDPAAPLSLKETVKGEAVDLAAGKGKQTYVVEFWATWCGPCRVSIPHLTELQAKYKDKNVTFVGISDETLEKVKPFVDKMGDKMAYVVALDADRKTSDAYMRAYAQDGIPTAFVVDKGGRVAWVGHPMGGLDEALDQILSGKYDLAAAQDEFAGREAKQRKQMELSQTFSKYMKLSNDGDPGAADVGARLLDAVGPDAQILNAIAWNILTAPGIKNRDVKFALKAAEAGVAASKGKEFAVVDTYARALADNGKLAEAIEQQKKAIALAKDEKAKEELTKTLKGYEDKAAAK
jgi:thiol-disulfide isomerase/thioredoxin